MRDVTVSRWEGQLGSSSLGPSLETRQMRDEKKRKKRSAIKASVRVHGSLTRSHRLRRFDWKMIVVALPIVARDKLK